MIDWLATIKPVLEALYFLSGIGLLATVIIGLVQLNLVKKDMKDRSRRACVEKSVECLTLFATRFIPAYADYREKISTELPNPTDTTYLYDGKFNIPINSLDKQLTVEVIIKQNTAVMQLFNELEFFCVAILEGLAIDEIIFTPVARIFCDFIKEEHLMIAVSRARGTPYKNLIKLYHTWNDRLEVEQLKLQKIETENKIKQKGNRHKNIPSIGNE